MGRDLWRIFLTFRIAGGLWGVIAGYIVNSMSLFGEMLYLYVLGTSFLSVMMISFAKIEDSLIDLDIVLYFTLILIMY